MIDQDLTRIGCQGNWRRYKNNPVFRNDYGETFDVTVIKVKEKLRMYLSWRSTNSIVFVEGVDGVHWSEPTIVLPPDFSTGWEDDVNRQIVIEKDGKYFMWYTGMKFLGAGERMSSGRSCIGFAESDDGIHFKRRKEPVMEPEETWEKTNLMCPFVIWDKNRNIFRMWYSAGGFWEPDQIGYAESIDGIHWMRSSRNPVFRPEPKNFWEKEIVSACQIIFMDNWYYMFYIGFEDMYKATINVARSKDGITGWQRYPNNPIIAGGPEGSWDVEAVYKPWVMHMDGQWLLWANGRQAAVEQVREDGNFGPQNSMDDYWSRFIMLKVLRQYYEIEKKEETFAFIERYLRYISNSIENKPVSEWAKARVGEVLYCIKWVYEYKPQKWLLKLQNKLRCQALNWTELFDNFPFVYPTAYYYNWEELSKYQNSEILKLMKYHETHVVNVVMGLKYPALEGCFDEDLRKCGIAVEAVDTLTKFHGVASGTVNGDEHLSGASPSQGSELCAVVELMFSLETMLEITGEAKLADRLEKIAYNAYPAAITENYMAHQYLQQANQVLISDQKRNWFNNDNTSNLFGLEPNFGCCTANMHQGWPKLVNSLWFKQKNTLVSMVFAPSKVHTLISQKEVQIELNTKYPFEETLTYHVINADCCFCLKIRIPQWCRQPEITVDNRKNKRVEGSFFVVEGFFGSGDTIAVRFPMEIRLSQWFHKSQAVERGCLLYGLNLEEKWHVEKECMGICDYSVSTAETWNYAINRKDTPVYVKGTEVENPYSKENPSSKIYLKAKQLKQWNMYHNSADAPPVSPVEITGVEKTIELIPFGATALRISQFPYYE